MRGGQQVTAAERSVASHKTLPPYCQTCGWPFRSEEQKRRHERGRYHRQRTTPYRQQEGGEAQ